MSPILIRPVREQLEHDRLVRFLQTRYQRLGEIAVNVGDERTAPVRIGQADFFPDLVLIDGRKVVGVVEVETGESVNNLEAMAQWVHFSRTRAPFHLYVPVLAFDAARRLCDAHHVRPSEIWTYRAAQDGFDLVRMVQTAAGEAAASAAASRASAARAAEKKRESTAPKVTARTAPAATARTGKRPVTKPEKPEKTVKTAKVPKIAKPAKPAKPAKTAKPTKTGKTAKTANGKDRRKR